MTEASRSAPPASGGVGIIGLGYVGLPLARAFAGAGVRAIGFDIDGGKVERLNAGTSYIKQIPDAAIAQMREQRFEATADFSRLSEPDAILICVPTPLTESREPDLTLRDQVGGGDCGSAAAGAVGRAREHDVSDDDAERRAADPGEIGTQVWEGLFLAFSPEREDPGNQQHALNSIPKVVGGLDPSSSERACALYSQIVPKVVRVSSPEVAEACKILENTYRAINIALVNELKVLYDKMGIDVWEVIDAAKTKPFGFQAFYPGPGLGGHCIPIDPFYLTWVAKQYGFATRFIELAGEVNTGMPSYVVSRLSDALNEQGKSVKGSKIAILGMAYKKDVDDPRESPGFELMDLLLKKGATVTYNDPHIPVLPPMRHYPHLRMQSQELTPAYLAAQDCVLIATDHSAYDYPAIVAQSRLVVDTRNATRTVTTGREKIVKA
jgi:UDP-N-acetyl-D-glucosamine dehydrogenase